jgi:membrane protein involved in colicin uptake
MEADANAKRIAEAKKTADKAKKATGTNVRSAASLPAAATKAKSVDDFIGALVDERMTG